MADITSSPILFQLVRKNTPGTSGATYISDEFVEQDYPTMIIDALVFIQGAEVSDYMTGSLSVTLSDRDGPNTATITLDNAQDRFVLTPENLDTSKSTGGIPGVWRLPNPTDKGVAQYSERPKYEIYKYKNQDYINPKTTNIDAGQKIALYSARSTKRQKAEQGNQLAIVSSGSGVTAERKWPLNPRSIIFHKNDPVKIFLKNPLTERDEWFYGFTGYIDNAQVTTSYIEQSSEIQITCYDIKALMMKMRVQMNPILGIIVPEPLFVDQDAQNLFADLMVPTNLSHPFTNLSLEEAIKTLIIGSSAIQRKNSRGGTVNVRGVGQFTMGKTVIYPGVAESANAPDENAIRILDQWHALGLIGPSLEASNIANANWLTKAECIDEGKGCTSDGPTAPHKGQIHFLLPKDGTGARNLTQYSFEAGTEQREWSSRYEVIHDFISRLDYQWIVAPNGDMMFEFPMYDFIPTDFGQWARVFTFDKHLTDTSYADETGDIPTVLTVTGGFAFTTAAPNLPQGLMPRAMVAAPILASRVGINPEQHALPFVASNQHLKVLAQVEFQKRLANSSVLDVNFAFRPFLFPNRPVVNDVEKRMGIASSVTNSVAMFQDGTCNAVLKYIRTVREDGTYRLITGAAHMPISYRKIFPSDSEGGKKTGTTTLNKSK